MLFAVLLWLGFASAADNAAFLTWADGLEVPGEHPHQTEAYRFYAELMGEVAAAVRERPGIVEVEEIGRSIEGRPLWAFHVARPGDAVERKVLVFSAIHALEWIAAEVATETLLEGIAHPAPGVRLTVIPMLNPDGRAKTERDLLSLQNKYRRGNSKNVDLNRDFAINRDSRAIWRRMPIARKYYYTSKAPLSQPESRALDALCDRERFQRAASLHAFGGFFYYPWSGRFTRIPRADRDEHLTLGRAMEAAQGRRAYKTRQLGRWAFVFRALGTELDHIYGTYGTRTFLVELTRSGVNPLLGPGWRTYFRWYNPQQSAPHIERGVRAMRALVRHEALPSERSTLTTP
jgi:carboxypeptidase T